MANPICSTDCTSSLPIVRFPTCGTGGLESQSEIQRIFIGKTTRTPFTNWLAEGEWITNVDNSGTSDTDDTLRVFDVIGDLPAGTVVSKTFSKGRTLTITKNRTLPFTIDLISSETYEAARAFECGGQYRFWFETKGGKMYGGNKGFLATMDINLVLARGDDGTEELQATLSWQGKFMPERGVSPIFEGEVTNDDDDGGETVTYDTTITFVSSGTASNTPAGVQVNLGTSDPDAYFKFDAITTITNPDSLTGVMKYNGTEVGRIDTRKDYEGESFQVKLPSSGTVLNGVFHDGDITLTAA